MAYALHYINHASWDNKFSLLGNILISAFSGVFQYSAEFVPRRGIHHKTCSTTEKVFKQTAHCPT
jgi:hypothetical protein